MGRIMSRRTVSRHGRLDWLNNEFQSQSQGLVNEVASFLSCLSQISLAEKFPPPSPHGLYFRNFNQESSFGDLFWIRFVSTNGWGRSRGSIHWSPSEKRMKQNLLSTYL